MRSDECGVELQIEAKALFTVESGLTVDVSLTDWTLPVFLQPLRDTGEVVEVFAGQF